MEFGTQFSVFLPNKPGHLAKLIDAIAKAKCNIVAITVSDASEHGVLRIVVDNNQAIQEVLGQLNIPFTETQVILRQVPNKPGALADIFSVLSEAKINLNYAYSSSGAPGGKTTCILSTSDMKNTFKVLERLDEKRKKKRRRSGTKKSTVKTRSGRKGR